jgi:hypothetical protein
MQARTLHASWQELLATPTPASHILQIYDSDDFLAAGVALFAAEGLRRGDAVLLTGTQAHLRGVRRELDARGVDAPGAERGGQLMLSDAQLGVAAVVRDGEVDPARFQKVAGDALARAAADRRFTGVRWWGEMSNVLYRNADRRASLATEDLGEALAQKHGVKLFCSFLCDRFDAAAYDGVLPEICCKHSHVIPAEDYVHHRLAVNRAIAEVIGDIRGPLLQSLLSWKGLACELPSSQVLLFWIRDAMPERFRDVLDRARAYTSQQAEGLRDA